MLVIGVCGEKGAGKGTFSKLLLPQLGGKKVAVVRSSDVLNDTLKLWGIESTRASLQNLALAMDAQFGKGTLSQAVRRRILESEADVVIFEGIRWKSDVDMLRSFGTSLTQTLSPRERRKKGEKSTKQEGDFNILVYVTADASIRWERTRARGEKSDESEASWEQFEREEKAGTEVEIASIGKDADVLLENNGGAKEFENRVKEFSTRLER